MALPSGVHAKLAVGSVDDPAEREADRAAEHVLRMPTPPCGLSSAVTQISRKCGTCQEEDEAKGAQNVRRTPSAPASTGGGDAPPIVREVLGSSGQSLDGASQSFFGPPVRPGLRPHQDSHGCPGRRLSPHRRCAAYTAGHHIVFDAGQYAPTTHAGKALLAHELAHVVQQTNQTNAPPSRATAAPVRRQVAQGTEGTANDSPSVPQDPAAPPLAPRGPAAPPPAPEDPAATPAAADSCPSLPDISQERDPLPAYPPFQPTELAPPAIRQRALATGQKDVPSTVLGTTRPVTEGIAVPELETKTIPLPGS
jgi:hypothetical protein